MKDQDLEQLVRSELKHIMPNMIWLNDHGEYEVFGKYKIIPQRPGYEVWVHATCVGKFNSTKTALSWCIADKYKAYNTARDILNLDTKLQGLTSDINARAKLADRSDQPIFRETVEVKLESKLIRKKKVETELTKCINWAKYIQTKGFNNETVRTGR